MALLEATEDDVHLARAHVACAEVALNGGDDRASAPSHLEEAERLLKGHAARAERAAIRRLQAELALQEGDLPSAVSLAEQALVLAATLPRELADAWLTLARARAAAGDGSADQAFVEAVALIALHGGGREHTDVLLAYGRYLRDGGREQEALSVFERAAEVAASLHGEPSRTSR